MRRQLTDGEINEWRAYRNKWLTLIGRGEKDDSGRDPDVQMLRAISYMLLLHDAFVEIDDAYSYEQVPEIISKLNRELWQ